MRKTFILILVVTFILVFIGILMANAFNNKKINILLYGVDGKNNSEVERSDAIILLNYNFDKKEIIATSIPRDSYVKITCKNNQYDKINHAYAYGGEECLNNTVKELFGITELNNILINFDDVVEVVDYFGLIEIEPQYTFCQSDAENKRTYCFEKSKKILVDGKQILAYMRARKNLPSGDFDRVKNQRQILKVLIDKFLKLSLIEKIKFCNYFKENVKTDLSIKDINLKKITNVQQINLKEYTLKGEDYINKYYYYKLDPIYLEKIKKYYI